MTHRRQGLSRTLPKDFTFPSIGEPRTPERNSIQLDVPPPPPRHSSCRLRRSRVRSGTDVFAHAEYDRNIFHPNPSDIPLPSIEFSSSHDATDPEACLSIPTSNDRFLAPPRDRVALKTPPAQIRAAPVDQSTGYWSTDDPQNIGETIERPGSSCSDSSVSSIETFASRRSVGGSCTSIESDSFDPFFLEIQPKHVESTPVPKFRRNKPPTRERWTRDMDNHLWNTYQIYLQDPTITPFKMTPGSIPPLGVTHRVAREAKKTWEKMRYRLTNQLPSTSQQYASGNSTPTPKTDTPKNVWPRSEASTRRRLKYLCKRKFCIAPHYQRLMMSRSPTPALDMVSHSSRESSQAEVPTSSSAVYATRDLGISLVSSSVPGPLTQLAMEEPPSNNSGEWSSQPVPCNAPHGEVDPFANRPFSFDEREIAPRLGSPFTYHTWGPNNSKKRVQRHTPRARRETIHVTGSRLRSPPRMDLLANADNRNIACESMTTAESPSDEETRQNLEELFRQGKLNDIGQRRIRIRNRGATMSSVNSGGLNQLFSPPSSSSKNDDSHREEKPAPHLRNLSGEAIKRLGSPFKIDPPKRAGDSPARFIRHAPSRSEPFARGLLPQARQTAQVGGQRTLNTLPYDPTEPGLSDAERIRRQILNMSYSRQ
ncbi:hypothetical protein BDV38DRAFT_123809 [Aspergillus pseudotamarii]|uniref:Uncharacterized protein n=1 Tax=Aspergillus pseudotamarii TaxID=132259 RepID=A0A5N6SPU8_ASPPS|nr:uncharacterized protein BDV38DRAFT_123809 [Aspergillus pseudotamarii]KAE8135869.1 hypothetical protein BDV38DRAFT_123809 [Aspergillus pseudotamarii]